MRTLVWNEHFYLEVLSEQAFEDFMIAIACICSNKSIQVTSTGEGGMVIQSIFIFSLSISLYFLLTLLFEVGAFEVIFKVFVRRFQNAALK